MRRLAAGDTSIDVVSLDVVFTAEFSNAGFLRPYTAQETSRLTAGMLPAPVKTGMWDDKLFARAVQVERAAALVPQVAGRRGRRGSHQSDASHGTRC